MRRRLVFLLALIILALGASPQSVAACSILPAPPDQQARAVQDTIDRAGLIVRGTVVGARPVAVDGRYYQQLTLAVVTSWRGVPVDRVTIVGPSLTTDTGPASTLGVFTGRAPVPMCGPWPRAVGDDLLIFARNDGQGRLRLSTATSPSDPLATTLRAQLGAGAAPPPTSSPSPPLLAVLVGASVGAALLAVALVGRHRMIRRRRRG